MSSIVHGSAVEWTARMDVMDEMDYMNNMDAPRGFYPLMPFALCLMPPLFTLTPNP